MMGDGGSDGDRRNVSYARVHALAHALAHTYARFWSHLSFHV